MPALAANAVLHLLHALQAHLELVFGDGQQNLAHQGGELPTFADAVDGHSERLEVLVAAKAFDQAPAEAIDGRHHHRDPYGWRRGGRRRS